MSGPMEGVRVLEIAQFTFVPAAGAVLSDWGADVIKVEHAVTGDAQRGLVRVMGLDALVPGSTFYPIMEGPNRGKRSIGLDLYKPEAQEILRELVEQADVFLTNMLPGARIKMGIDVDQIKAINPKIIYVRGTAFGNKGPEREKGGYDSTGFWARSGAARATTWADATELTAMPTGAYGDNAGGMTIAGGVAAALYKRATTGESPVVDVSLLGVGAWSTSFGSNLAMLVGQAPPPPSMPVPGTPGNPLTGAYRTSDGKFIMLTMLQPGAYWPGFCDVFEKPEWKTDERFLTAESIVANGYEGRQLVAELFGSKTRAELMDILNKQTGQWALVADFWDISQDESLRANGLVAKVVDAEGVERELIAAPVLFDEENPTLSRAPQFAEHTDEILSELGFDIEKQLELKIAGAVT
ncbi:MAG: CoA transferase [Actinomycetota bacterium]|nr:CoA transferase [Actinomycetota bacterium]